jgi:hypothetical protein
MPKNKIIITIGILIALFPVFGFPHTWEVVFQVIGGLSIVFLSIMTSIDKRITLKAKAQKRHNKRRALVEPLTEGSNFGRRASDTDMNGNQIRFGRRATDIVLPVQTINPEDTTSQEFTL